MGILLATAYANRRHLLFCAGTRLGLCLLAVIGLGFSIAQPTVSPAGWLGAVAIWLATAVALFCWGVAPLRLLTRLFECYEQAIVVFDRVILLEQVELFIWRRKRMRVLGLIPTDISYLEVCCRMKPEEGKKRGKQLVYNELIFLALFETFEEAYERSLPCEYHLNLPPQRRRDQNKNFRPPFLKGGGFSG